MSAAAIRPIVTTLIRLGVSHVRCRAASQELTPVAPVAAAITHPAHIDPRLRKNRNPGNSGAAKGALSILAADFSIDPATLRADGLGPAPVGTVDAAWRFPVAGRAAGAPEFVAGALDERGVGRRAAAMDDALHFVSANNASDFSRTARSWPDRLDIGSEST